MRPALRKTWIGVMIVLFATPCVFAQRTTDVHRVGTRMEPAYTVLHRAAERNDVETLQKLLMDTARIDDQENSARWAPIHFAVMNRSYESLELLLKQGADPNVVDGRGRTPLHLAIWIRGASYATTLLRSGTDPNLQDVDGRTALHDAVHAGMAPTAANILGFDADPNITDNEGLAALDIALADGAAPLITLLEAHGAEARVAITAPREQRIHRAIARRSLKGVRYADVGVRTLSPAGLEPVHAAAQIGSLKYLRILVEIHGADANARDKNGFLPLHYAAEHDHSELVKYLIEKGNDPSDHENIPGWSPLHFAHAAGATGTIAVLTKFGADPEHRDRAGATAQSVAGPTQRKSGPQRRAPNRRR